MNNQSPEKVLENLRDATVHLPNHREALRRKLLAMHIEERDAPRRIGATNRMSGWSTGYAVSAGMVVLVATVLVIGLLMLHSHSIRQPNKHLIASESQPELPTTAAESKTDQISTQNNVVKTYVGDGQKPADLREESIIAVPQTTLPPAPVRPTIPQAPVPDSSNPPGEPEPVRPRERHIVGIPLDPKDILGLPGQLLDRGLLQRERRDERAEKNTGRGNEMSHSQTEEE